MATPRLPSARPTFLHSDRALARAAQPLVRFFRVEAAGGIVLLAAAIAAVVWANSPWQASYESLWATRIRVEVGSYVYDEDLLHVVNDALMAVFFFVVGTEIKRELVVGELSDRRSVALPTLAALGGMVIPALIYATVNGGGDGAAGWGIPMATDIAFALGVVTVLGDRLPSSIRVMLLALAIVDDIGAIGVIAIFYSDGLQPCWLVAAATLALLVSLLHRFHVTSPAPFVAAGLALWLAIFESGVHATFAGVILGLLTPARPAQPELETSEIVDVLENRADLRAEEVRVTATLIRGSVSACDRLIDVLHPWTSYVILPIFALANAGIPLSADALTNPSAVFVGVAGGLVIGKPLGIVCFSWLTVRSGLARLPDDARWGHIAGIGATAGIGFTVSLFITALAFDSAQLQDDAKTATLVASVIAASLGAAILHAVAASDRRRGDS